MSLAANKHPRRPVAYGKRCADGFRRTSEPNMRKALRRLYDELHALVRSSPAEVHGDAYGVILTQDAERAITTTVASIERLWNAYAVESKPAQARAVPKRAKTLTPRKA